jgi:DnaJ like chaperone protein
MSIWSGLAELISTIGESLGDFLGGFSRKSTAPEKSMAFTIGMIALGAKMARADGVVTADEVAAFYQVFQVPEKDHAALERVFNLAKQDVAGFDSYAQQIARLFSKKAAILESVVDGLFHIAKADGVVHEDELAYLSQVATIFGFEAADFARIRSRHVQIDDDPYEILGVSRDTTKADIKIKYRKLVRDLHPDKQIAAGVPAEMVRLATERLAQITDAYGRIMKGGAG